VVVQLLENDIQGLEVRGVNNILALVDKVIDLSKEYKGVWEREDLSIDQASGMPAMIPLNTILSKQSNMEILGAVLTTLVEAASDP